jgi:hypothetical protein
MPPEAPGNQEHEFTPAVDTGELTRETQSERGAVYDGVELPSSEKFPALEGFGPWTVHLDETDRERATVVSQQLNPDGTPNIERRARVVRITVAEIEALLAGSNS